MNTNEMTIEVVLTDEMVAQLAEMLETRPKDTVETLAQRCLQFGIQNKLYRTRRNKSVYAQNKAEGALIDSLRNDPKFKATLAAKMKEMGY